MWNIYALPKYHKNKPSPQAEAAAATTAPSEGHKFYCDAQTCKRVFSYSRWPIWLLLFGFNKIDERASVKKRATFLIFFFFFFWVRSSQFPRWETKSSDQNSIVTKKHWEMESSPMLRIFLINCGKWRLRKDHNGWPVESIFNLISFSAIAFIVI